MPLSFQQLINKFDSICGHGFHRRTVFEDFLEMAVCALSLGQMEDRYLEVAKKYCEGEPGRRAIDRLAEVLVEVIDYMEEHEKDVLGDLYMEMCANARAGQFFTPESLCQIMAQTTLGNEPKREFPNERISISDPACGSGRCLLAAAKIQPHSMLFATDIDKSCVLMTCLNFALWGRKGYVTHGNTITLDVYAVYRVGFPAIGAITKLTGVPSKGLMTPGGFVPVEHLVEQPKQKPKTKTKSTAASVVTIQKVQSSLFEETV